MINIQHIALEVLTNCYKTKVSTLTSLKAHRKFSKDLLNSNTNSRKHFERGLARIA